MKLDPIAMARIYAGIEAAETPLDALVAALRQTFIELGAGDLSVDGPKIDGRDWPMDAEQWIEIGNWLLAVPVSDAGAVNLGLDWMNLGPSGSETNDLKGVVSR